MKLFSLLSVSIFFTVYTLCVPHHLGAWPNCSCRGVEIIRMRLQPIIVPLFHQRWVDLPSSTMSHIKTLCYLLSQCSSTSALPDTACYTSIAAGRDGKIPHEPLMRHDIRIEKHDIFLSDLLLWGLDVTSKVLMG